MNERNWRPPISGLNGMDRFVAIGESLKPMLEPIRLFQREWSAIGRIVSPVLLDAAAALQRLPDAIKLACCKAGQQGWYLSPQLPISEIHELATLSPAEIDSFMISFWREEFDVHVRELLDRHPERRGILDSAVQAHKLGMYALSVPVFVIQADGICSDATGAQLYSRRGKDGLPTIAKTIDGIETLRKCFLESLRVPMPITAWESEHDQADGTLNRHEIVHGIAVDYASEANSLKAMSLVCCVSAWLLNRDD